MQPTQIKELLLYSFDQFDEKMQQTIIDNNRDINVDHEWWEFVYEDAKTIAALFGLDIDKIYFSGFWSQGNGACFKGDYAYKKGGLKAVKEYAPNDKDLHEIVQNLQDIQRPYFYQLEARTRQQGHYSHSGCMSVDVYHNEDFGELDYSEFEDDITDQLRYFADWIYSRLEDEYEYLTSDEQIKEVILSDEYLFTENGENG